MKPEPKTIKVVCTACGLDWDAHGTKPTLAKCVDLLKIELAKKPTARSAPYTWSVQHPLQQIATTATPPLQVLGMPAHPPRIEPEAKAS